MQTYQLADQAATQAFGVKLGQILPAGSLLLLQGDLGSGKTTLIQGLGLGLGIKDSIESPTFTLINEYLEGRVPLYHLDLYRLEPAEIIELHLESYWDGLDVEPGIVAIEWADRLPYHPQDYIELQLTYNAEQGRTLYFTAIGQTNNELIPKLRP